MEIDTQKQEIVSVIVNDDGSLSYETRDRQTPPQVDQDHHVYHDARWIEVRRERDRLLADTDWVTLRASDTGNPAPQEWVTYRQALRNITKQKNPFFIKWPTAPEIQVRPVVLNLVPPGEIPVTKV